MRSSSSISPMSMREAASRAHSVSSTILTSKRCRSASSEIEMMNWNGSARSSGSREETYVPSPCRDTRMFMTTRARIASRSVERDTPSWRASSRSAGKALARRELPALDEVLDATDCLLGSGAPLDRLRAHRPASAIAVSTALRRSSHSLSEYQATCGVRTRAGRGAGGDAPRWRLLLEHVDAGTTELTGAGASASATSSTSPAAGLFRDDRALGSSSSSTAR